MKNLTLILLASLAAVAHANDKTSCDLQAKKAINYLHELNDGLGELQVTTMDKQGLGNVLTYRDTKDGRFTAKVLDGIDICIVLSTEYDQN